MGKKVQPLEKDGCLRINILFSLRFQKKLKKPNKSNLKPYHNEIQSPRDR
jgi:hypothetical protein